MASMSLTPYRRVLARPGVSRLLLFGVLARVPATAGGVVLTLHVVLGLGRGYGAAGLVATAVTVGMAVGSPWRGRAVDRLGLRRALVPSILAEAAVWGVAPFVHYEVLLVLAFFGGLLGLPIFTVTRQSLSVLVTEGQRRTAYSLDSMGVELSFMLGPALGVVVATQVSSTVAMLGVGVCMVTAGLALFAFDPPTRSQGQPEPVAGVAAPAGGGVRSWFTGGLAAVLAASAAATIVLAGTDVGVVAVLRSHDAIALTGLVFAAWGLASMLGAVVFGALRRPVSPLVLLAVLAVLTIPVGLAGSPWMLALAILPAGALCAPLITATAEEVSRRVPERVRGEAMGWHGSSLTVGTAVGAPLAGSAIDAFGAWAGFAAVGTVGLVLAGAGLAAQRLVVRRQTRGGADVAGLAGAAEAAGLAGAARPGEAAQVGGLDVAPEPQSAAAC
jgi:MFS family permease